MCGATCEKRDNDMSIQRPLEAKETVVTVLRILKVSDFKGRNRSCVPIVPDTFEEIETLPESQLCRVFPEYHIVTTTRRDEYDRSNVVEALYPFSSLITLTTDVEHTVKTGKYSINIRLRIANRI